MSTSKYNVKVRSTEFCSSVDTADADLLIARQPRSATARRPGGGDVSDRSEAATIRRHALAGGRRSNRCTVQLGSEQICQHKALLIKRSFSAVTYANSST